MRIEDLNINDRIILYEKNEYGTVIDKSYADDWAEVSIDGGKQPIYIRSEHYFDKLPISFKRTPKHYAGTDNVDVIEFTRQQFTHDEWVAAMKFNIIKYATRLGRKDDMNKEIDKIIDYAQRLKEGL